MFFQKKPRHDARSERCSLFREFILMFMMGWGCLGLGLEVAWGLGSFGVKDLGLLAALAFLSSGLGFGLGSSLGCLGLA